MMTLRDIMASDPLDVTKFSPSSTSSIMAEGDEAGDVIEMKSIASDVARQTSSSGQKEKYIVSITSEPENEISLTWKNLWVTVPDKEKRGRKSLLQKLNGYAEPGKILAIMGPSGCGKSTLLDALAGRLGAAKHQSGEIRINGRNQELSFGTSAYVTQDDILLTTLTVREAVYYSAQLQLSDSMSNSEKRERAEMTIREMGLEDSMDTTIGGWNKRGISGGQKRRVSICIEILTRPKLLFLDEPTSGLDSAAAFHVMNRISQLAGCHRMNVIASIHQPSSEVFMLFHNLCLLCGGRTIYFGPASMAKEFFTSSGFPCPTLSSPSEHFLRTINKDFDIDTEKEARTEEAIDLLLRSYKTSDTYRQVQDRMLICQQKGVVNFEEKRRSQASFTTQCLVLTKRSFVNMHRDLGYYWLRLCIYIALCLCIGTEYYDIGFTYGSIQARGGMIMFTATLLTFMSIGGFPSFVEDMKVFGQERLNGHYGVAAYVIGNTLSSIPYLFMNSLIPGALAYYLVGLQKKFDHFVYFALVLFVTVMLVESLMMIVASLVPNFLLGIITGSGIQGMMMLNGGFFRLPNDIPDPIWKYPVYYISFHKYASQGLYKNEFEGLTIHNDNLVGGNSSIITGEDILRNFWQVEMGYSKWIDLVILFGMVIIYRLIFLGIIKATEMVKPILERVVTMTTNSKKYNQVVIEVENPSSTPLQ